MVQEAGPMPSALSRRAPWVLLALAVSTLVALVLLRGPLIITFVPWDVSMHFDAGWRIFNGQTPHEDFLLPVGPFTFYVTALGMWLTDGSVLAVTVGGLCLLCLVTPVAAWVTSRRAPPWLGAGLTLLWAVMLVAPRPLGYSYRDLTFAMLYNRQGEVFLSLLYVLLFVPVRAQTSRRVGATETALAALLVVLLILTKINFGMLGVSALIFAAIFPWRGTVNARMALLILPVLALLAVLVTGLSPGAMVVDAVRNMREQSSTPRLLQIVHLVFNFWWVPVIVTAAGLLAAPEDPKARRHLWLTSAFVVASAIGLLMSNTLFMPEAPLIAVLLPLFLQRPLRTFRPWAIVALTVLAFLPLQTLQVDSVACVYTVVRKRGGESTPSLPGTRLADLRIGPEEGTNTRQEIDDGVRLLKQAFERDPSLRARVRLAVLEYNDPYSLAFSLKTEPGGNIWRNRERVDEFIDELSEHTHVLVPLPVDEPSGPFRDPDRFVRLAANDSYTLYEIRE